MARKKRQARAAGRLHDNPQLVEQRLLASSFPRLHMLLILSLAALGSFLSSATLVALGLQSMGVRYGFSVVRGYLSFLLLVRLWIAYQTRNWSFGRSSTNSNVGSLDVPDLSAWARAADAGAASPASYSGGGGTFGGAGASGGWGDHADSGSSGVIEAAAESDEALPLLIAAVVLLGGLVALGFVVYSSPLLFAEVLLDVAVVGAAYGKNRRHERAHWAAGVLRRTYKPALLLAVLAVVFGFAVQSTAPAATTLGAVLNSHAARPSK